MLKIGIDAHVLGKKKGGVERYVKELVSFLPDLMPEHDFIVFINTQYDPSNSRRDNVQYIALPFSDPLIQRSIILPFVITRYRLDILHVQRILPLFCGCKSVVSIHDLLPLIHQEDHRGFRNSMIRILTGRSIKKANRVLTVSQTVKHEIINRFQVDTHKVAAIYNGIDHNHFMPFKRSGNDMPKENNPGQQYKLLYIGALEPRKNLEIVLLALNRLIHEMGKNVSLTIAGGARDQNYSHRLKQMVKKLGIKKDLFFTGYISDERCLELLKDADVFLAPSRGEGFDLPPLEAMACGVPVVCSDIPVHRELFDGYAAFFQPDAEKHLADVINDLLSDHQKRTLLKNNGRKPTLNFKWEHTACQIAEIYRNIELEKSA